MERCVHVFLLCAFFCNIGTALAVSNKAFQVLNSKVNLLTLEVLDLRTELEIERAKTARLEELLNGTDTVGNTGSSAPASGFERGDTLDPSSMQQPHRQDESGIHMLDRAFRDLKHQVKDLEADVKRPLEQLSDEAAALNSSIHNINSKLNRVSKTTEANANDVAEQSINLQEVSGRVTQVQRLYDEEINAVKIRLHDLASGSKTNAERIDETRNTMINLQQILMATKFEVKRSAFTYDDPTGSDPCRFTNRITDIGNAYSSSTGKFTCKYPGIYFFALSLTKVRSSDDAINDRAHGKIRVNGVDRVIAWTDPQDDSDNGSHEASATLTVHLSKGDVVDVKTISGEEKSHHSHSQFTGFLLLPD